MSLRRLAIQAVIVASAIAAIVFFKRSGSVEERLIEARKLLARRESARAADIASDVLRLHPENCDALMVAGRAASDVGNFDEALEFYSRISNESEAEWSDARVREAEICLNRSMEIDRAEDACRRLLDVEPDNRFALEQLIFIYSVQTRVHELVPLQLQLIRGGVVSPEILMSLLQGDLLYPDEETIALFQPPGNSHAGLLLAKARIASLRGNSEIAQEALMNAVELQPDLAEAQARLGRFLTSHGQSAEIERWLKHLPDSALEHPGTWEALGKWFASSSDWQASARCYWEAGRKNGASLIASHGLGRALAVLDREEDAEPFLDRAVRLERYGKTFDQGRLRDGPDDQGGRARLQEAASEAAALGLLWEAYAFGRLATMNSPLDSGPDEVSDFVLPAISGLLLTRTTPEKNPFQAIDLSDLRLPDFRRSYRHVNGGQESHIDSAANGDDVAFADVADEVGFEFRFNNGTQKSFSGAVKPYDFTGGGIAVIDADTDGWPDIFCTQGGAMLAGSKTNADARSNGPTDRIFRNRRGVRFEDVSVHSLIPDVDFSQGVSTRDLNADGFPDIFVANLGRNRLLQNNGDGTFSDISGNVENDAGRWTTSCLICDVNRDGYPDLYSVNYLSGDIIERVCRDESGRIASCAPQDFPASQDQLHLGTTTGLFRDATDTVGVIRSDGKGLGILATDVDGNGLPELLIANDGVPNFYFEGTNSNGRFRLEETAMIRGLAVNRDGRSEAGMGIAAEDFNADGQLDFLVTNFMDETNTLYLARQSNRHFEDQTRQFGLGTPSVKQLGFGIQALDADLDGHADVIVANGHVDDFRDRGVPYQMQAVYYHNSGGVGFRALEAQDVGAYFNRLTLGRCVARLDWNRDGAEEAVIGHLNSRYALLRNSTAGRGRFVKISLRMSKPGLDDTGTVVSVRTDSSSFSRQFVSGGGYQATNERVLVMGLGECDSIRGVTVSWPDGHVDTFSGVAVGSEVLIRQGNARVFEIPR